MSHKPIHVLLVEDDDDHAELITLGLLARDDVSKTVDRVRDGEEALAYLGQCGSHRNAVRPDVVLLDLNLPKVSGHEVLAAIKSDTHLRTIPVVVLTTSTDSRDRAKAYFRQANSYLAKPADFGEFNQMIEAVSRYWTEQNQPIG